MATMEVEVQEDTEVKEVSEQFTQKVNEELTVKVNYEVSEKDTDEFTQKVNEKLTDKVNQDVKIQTDVKDMQDSVNEAKELVTEKGLDFDALCSAERRLFLWTSRQKRRN